MIIGVDMDGVLVDFAGAALPRIKTLWGLDVSYSDLTEPRIEKHVNQKLAEPVDPEALCRALFQPGFFASMLPYPGAIKAMHELEGQGHTLVIITKAYLQSAHIVQEKAEWLAMHLRGVKYQTIVVREMESKHLVNVDILVDDDPKALEHPGATSICRVHPWNTQYLESKTRKKPVHRLYSMDFLPWMVDMAKEVKNKELDQRELEAYLGDYR